MAFASLKDKRMDPSIKPQTLIGDESIEDVSEVHPVAMPSAGTFGVGPIENKATVTDRLGRTIAIRKLSAFDRLRLFEVLGSVLSGNGMYLSYAMSAACVTAIDGVPAAFPASKKSVEAMVKLLGDEGIDAIARAYEENFRVGETGDLEAIKN